MKFVFYVAEKDRNYGLAENVSAGMRVLGDHCDIIPQQGFNGALGGYDGAACLGLKRAGKRLLTSHIQAGQKFMFFDKGYMGRAQYMRVSLNAWQPLAYLQKIKRPPDRFERTGLKLAKRRVSTTGDAILFAGSSQKYCNFHDLGDATFYAERVIRKLKKRSKRPIIYRPKPSWAANHPDECKPIDGTEFSKPNKSIAEELRRCHLVVTHGSNAAFDALAAGVPVMVLGEGICKPMSMGEEYGRLEQPSWPNDEERRQFFYDVAYCQFTEDEYRNGTAWRIMRETLVDLPVPGHGRHDDMDHLIRQYQEMHAQPKYFRGRDAQKHFARIGRLVLDTATTTLLDYGCGKGEQYEQPIALQEAWGVDVTCYDPGVERFAAKPNGKMFDGVICCDVMEHIPEPHVETILRDVIAHASKFAFFSIATTPASKTLPDGRNCHLTIRSEEWWREQIDQVREDYPGVRVEAWIQPDPEHGKPFPDDED